MTGVSGHNVDSQRDPRVVSMVHRSQGCHLRPKATDKWSVDINVVEPQSLGWGLTDLTPLPSHSSPALSAQKFAGVLGWELQQPQCRRKLLSWDWLCWSSLINCLYQHHPTSQGAVPFRAPARPREGHTTATKTPILFLHPPTGESRFHQAESFRRAHMSILPTQRKSQIQRIINK